MAYIQEYFVQGATEVHLQTWGENVSEMSKNGLQLAYIKCDGRIVVCTQFGLFL